MTTETTLTREDTGTMAAVRPVEGEPTILEQLEAERAGEPVATWAQFNDGLATLRVRIDVLLGEADAVLNPPQPTVAETPWAELPPDPALELSPEALDAAYEAEQAREGLAEQARRYVRQQALREAAAQGTATGSYVVPMLVENQCNVTINGLFDDDLLICIRPPGHALPHRTDDGAEFWPRRSWRDEWAELWADVKRLGRAMAWWRA